LKLKLSTRQVKHIQDKVVPEVGVHKHVQYRRISVTLSKEITASCNSNYVCQQFVCYPVAL